MQLHGMEGSWYQRRRCDVSHDFHTASLVGEHAFAHVPDSASSYSEVCFSFWEESWNGRWVTHFPRLCSALSAPSISPPAWISFLPLIHGAHLLQMVNQQQPVSLARRTMPVQVRRGTEDITAPMNAYFEDQK